MIYTGNLVMYNKYVAGTAAANYNTRARRLTYTRMVMCTRRTTLYTYIRTYTRAHGHLSVVKYKVERYAEEKRVAVFYFAWEDLD